MRLGGELGFAKRRWERERNLKKKNNVGRDRNIPRNAEEAAGQGGAGGAGAGVRGGGTRGGMPRRAGEECGPPHFPMPRRGVFGEVGVVTRGGGVSRVGQGQVPGLFGSWGWGDPLGGRDTPQPGGAFGVKLLRGAQVRGGNRRGATRWEPGGGTTHLPPWLPPRDVPPPRRGSRGKQGGDPLPTPSQTIAVSLLFSGGGGADAQLCAPPATRPHSGVIPGLSFSGGCILGGGARVFYFGAGQAAQGAEAAGSHHDTSCLEGFPPGSTHARPRTPTHAHAHPRTPMHAHARPRTSTPRHACTRAKENACTCVRRVGMQMHTHRRERIRTSVQMHTHVHSYAGIHAGRQMHAQTRVHTCTRAHKGVRTPPATSTRARKASRTRGHPPTMCATSLVGAGGGALWVLGGSVGAKPFPAGMGTPPSHPGDHCSPPRGG